mgnify:FL=1
MQEITGLDYLQLTKGQRFAYKLKRFFTSIPNFFVNLGKKIWGAIKALIFGIGRFFKHLFHTFKEGDWKTRTSYFVMGFGSIARGQILRGLLFFAMEALFILYMIFYGGYYLGKLAKSVDLVLFQI